METTMEDVNLTPEEREKRERGKKEPYMFRDAMLKLLLAETLPYAKLIAD